MFELRNVTYRDILKIDDLTLGEKQITAINGPSGGGKTTLLKLLINLISPDGGEIYYKGEELETYPPLKLREKVKMLAQNPALLGETIIEEFQKAEELACHNNSSIDDYRWFVEKMRLGKSLDEKSANLSGGEKQRVALARLLLLEPETLLLDEPAASLDTGSEKYILDFLEDYARNNNTTIIMVTHAPKLADRIADQKIAIKEGELKEVKYTGGNNSKR